MIAQRKMPSSRGRRGVSGIGRRGNKGKETIFSIQISFQNAKRADSGKKSSLSALGTSKR
jgi:hypothetical protein